MSTGIMQINQIVGNNFAFYERCYFNCQPDIDGYVAADKAADMLKKSGLSDVQLAQIWNMSDDGCKGKLTKTEFCTALKYVSLAQNGLEVKSDNLFMSCSAPRLLSSSASLSPSIGGSAGHWLIPNDDQTKFSKLFDTLLATNPSVAQSSHKLHGDVVRPVLMNSKLSQPILSHIWSLSDIDRDSHLDRDEFILAMHLVYRSMSTTPYTLPDVLPPSLVPPSKRLGASSTSSLDISSNSLPRGSWIVGKLEKEQYDQIFHAADTDNDGFINGLEVKPTFLASGLPQKELAQIWELCDTCKSGKLNSEQFALAMHFINQCMKSAGTYALPASLSVEMMPPSMRGSVGHASPTQSDIIYSEIDQLRRSRLDTEMICRQLELDIRQQQTEVTQLTSELDRSQRMIDQLELQKQEAQLRLDELQSSNRSLQSELDEVREQCSGERAQLDNLRRQIDLEERSVESRRSELSKLQEELAQMMKKESGLLEESNKCRVRLAELDRETERVEKQLEGAEMKQQRYDELRTELVRILEQLETFLSAGGDGELTVQEEYIEQLINTKLDPKEPVTSIQPVINSNRPAAKANMDSLFDAWPPAITQSNELSLDDPFLQSDPFMTSSGLASSAAVSNHDEDPFNPSNKDPFAPTTSTGQDDPFSNWSFNDVQSNAFSPGVAAPAINNSSQNDPAVQFDAVEELFKHMNTDHEEELQSSTSPWQSPITGGRGSKAAPPRPQKGPVYNSELEWARAESERTARREKTVREKEAADLALAIKLSKADAKRSNK